MICRQREHGKRQETTPDTSTATQPMDTVDSTLATSKKQQRDTKRAMDDRALKASPSMARWKLLISRKLWTARKATCDAVWAAWMRSRCPEARQEVRLKLRTLLWRAWACPQPDGAPGPSFSPASRTSTLPPMGPQVLGALSLRDRYIRARTRAFINHLHPQVQGVFACKALWTWLGFRQKMDFDRTHKAARSPETAGLTTPTSARNRKKTRSGRK